MKLTHWSHLRSAAAAATAVTLASAGCASSSRASPQSSESAAHQTTTTSAEQLVTRNPAETGNAAETMGAGAVQENATHADALTTRAAPLEDAQIAQLASDISDGELQKSRWSADAASDPRVTLFAQRLLFEHRQMLLRMQEVIRVASITPVGSPQSTNLRASLQATLAMLKAESGPTFDRSYINDQINEHEAALDLLDGQLIPQATGSELRTALQVQRMLIAEHLQLAKDVWSALPHPLPAGRRSE